MYPGSRYTKSDVAASKLKLPAANLKSFLEQNGVYFLQIGDSKYLRQEQSQK